MVESFFLDRVMVKVDSMPFPTIIITLLVPKQPQGGSDHWLLCDPSDEVTLSGPLEQSRKGCEWQCTSDDLVKITEWPGL